MNKDIVIQTLNYEHEIRYRVAYIHFGWRGDRRSLASVTRRMMTMCKLDHTSCCLRSD